eukprot:CFRG0442T1
MGKDCYAILGVPRTASDDEIRKAYRKLAVVFHPDKNKDPDAVDRFKEIGYAYGILSDSCKKSMYDKFGEGVFSGGGGCKVDPNEIFKQFFGDDPCKMFSNARSGGSCPLSSAFGLGAAGLDGLHSFTAGLGSLGDRNPFAGFGAMPMGVPMGGMSVNCGTQPKRQDKDIEYTLECTLEELHTGMTKKMRIMQNHNSSSPKCDSKILDIKIVPGWKAGTRIRFPKEGDRNSTAIPADIVFIIQEKPHPRFERHGNDLLHTQRITLCQALTGFTADVDPIDPTDGDVSRQIDEIVGPRTRIVVKGKGMPLHKSPGVRGNLIYRFDITFPAVLDDNQRRMVHNVLGEDPAQKAEMDFG